MKVRLFSLLALPILFAISPAPANAAPLFVAAVSIATPAESLESRAAIRESLRPHVQPLMSPARAALWSVAGTVAPTAVGAAFISNHHYSAGAIAIGSGLLFGPAVGYIGAGLHERGSHGVLLRLGITAVSFGVAAGSVGTTGTLEDIAGPAIALAGGAAALTIAAIADCALVPHEVGRASRLSVAVAPMVVPSNGSPAIGLAVRF